MSRPVVPIAAIVADTERAAIDHASRNIARSLSEATGQHWTCDCRFVRVADLQDPEVAGSIVVTSLGPMVDAPERWEDAERQLRSMYAGLCERGRAIFICTVLRHTAGSDPTAALRRRIRIRRLNLLAAEISREHGAFVIDIDRTLADVGARRLGTDYTLKGEAAEKLAGDTIAMEVVLNGLDDFVNVEMQDRAKGLLADSRSTVAPLEIKPNLMAIGQGRHKQTVTTIVDTDQQSHASWLIYQVLRGQISLPQALEKLHKTIRRRGARQSFAMLASGIARLIGGRP